MATTIDQSGSFALAISIMNQFSGDTTGARVGQMSVSTGFDCDAALPTMIGATGFVAAAEVTCAAGDWWLASTTDPFQGMGDAVVDDGATPVGKKLKVLAVYSDPDNTGNITIARAAANGCPVFAAANDAYVITPGGLFLFYDPNGTVVTNLQRGTNDILTISVSAGAPVAQVLMIFGD